MKQLIFLILFTLTISKINSQTQTGYFNGVNSYVQLPSSASLFNNFTNKISIEAWICITDTNFGGSWGNGSIIQSGNQNRYAFFVNHDRRIYYYQYPWSTQFHGNVQVPLNTWTHVAVVYNGQNSFTGIYINGVLDSSTNIHSGNIGGDTQTPHISIGAYYYNSSFNQNFFKGYIDEVRVWKIDRTQSQLQQNICEAFIDSNLVGYWRFNNNYSDTSFYGNNGTNNNTIFIVNSYGCNFPLSPVLLSPSNHSINVSFTPTLFWNTVSGATSYKVQVSTNTGFTNIVDSSTVTTNQRTIPAGRLNLASTYYWRVNASNANGTGLWSEVWDFTTILTGVQKISSEIPNEYKLYNNYPNPFNPVTNIKFDIPELSITKLIIYDILGKEIKTLVNEKIETGGYTVNWNASNFPSGIYFYKIITDKFSETKKMILIR